MTKMDTPGVREIYDEALRRYGPALSGGNVPHSDGILAIAIEKITLLEERVRILELMWRHHNETVCSYPTNA